MTVSSHLPYFRPTCDSSCNTMVHVFRSALLTLPFLLASSAGVYGHGGVGRDVLQTLDFLGQEESLLEPLAVEDMLARTGQSAVRKPAGQPWSLYLPVFADAASPCGVALAAMASDLQGHVSLGVLQMVDSWGKLRDGYLHGTPFVLGLGSFGECIHAHSPALGIKGRYCSVFSLDNKTRLKADADAKLRLAQASANVDIGLFTQYGTCIPDACTEADMEDTKTKIKVDLSDLRERASSPIRQDLPSRSSAGRGHTSRMAGRPHRSALGPILSSFLSVMLAVILAGTAADVYYRAVTSSAPNLG
ncbi:uncharacterized protein LOC134779778 [Penaeus indicus]|uniref:uncharacterized protein LOC134779778 n=1 Tax=Penaeus indicus TaxID=29960 RepID=UPI00300CE8DF